MRHIANRETVAGGSVTCNCPLTRTIRISKNAPVIICVKAVRGAGANASDVPVQHHDWKQRPDHQFHGANLIHRHRLAIEHPISRVWKPVSIDSTFHHSRRYQPVNAPIQEDCERFRRSVLPREAFRYIKTGRWPVHFEGASSCRPSNRAGRSTVLPKVSPQSARLITAA